MSDLQHHGTIFKFYRLLDERKYENMKLLMHPDGIWVRMGQNVDPGSLVKTLSGRPGTLSIHHILFNLHVSEKSPGEVRLKGYMTIFKHDDHKELRIPAPLRGPTLLEDWHGTLRPWQGDWLIHRIEGRKTFDATHLPDEHR